VIHTASQLKALVRNKSLGDSNKAQIIIRNYAMERFLERLSLSPYRDNLILKGGTLVSAMVGLDNRSTMDVDATIRNLPLSVADAENIIKDIAAVQLDDGMAFEIKSVAPIMDESDYSGVRVLLDATLDRIRSLLKIDLSTGDVITPRAIVYSYRLLFENRSISLLAYNLETMLAEKLETLIARGTANARMRDFYDIYTFETTQPDNIDPVVLHDAFVNTSNKRGSAAVMQDADLIVSEVKVSPEMNALWSNYRSKFDYAADIDWNDVMESIKRLCMITAADYKA
jgi:predicted nucleotidyltransferase component of viral defense system